jgi:DNA-binding transcriptional regulator YdaS (Cro superfamily)
MSISGITRVARPRLRQRSSSTYALSAEMALRIEKAVGVKMETLSNRRGNLPRTAVLRRRKRCHLHRCPQHNPTSPMVMLVDLEHADRPEGRSTIEEAL